MSMQDIDKAPANMGMPKKNTDVNSTGDGEALGGGKVQGMWDYRVSLTERKLAISYHIHLTSELTSHAIDSRTSFTRLRNRVLGRASRRRTEEQGSWFTGKARRRAEWGQERSGMKVSYATSIRKGMFGSFRREVEEEDVSRSSLGCERHGPCTY